MTDINPNATNVAPPSQQSQAVPPGNQTQNNNGQPLEKQMLELSRQQKQLRQEREAMKGMVSLDELKSRGQKDRNAVLRELGFDDLVKEDLNDPISALKKQIEDMQNQQKQERSAKEDGDLFENLKSKLSQKPDDYELISKLGYENQVFEAIKAHRDQHGEMPDEYEIANNLENILQTQVLSAATAKKIAALLKQAEPSPAPQARHPLDQSTTLNSSDRTSTQTPTDSAPTMSRQQMIEQAAKHIKFND